MLERAGLSQKHETVLRELCHIGTQTGIQWLRSLAGDELHGTVQKPSFEPANTLPAHIGGDDIANLVALEQSFDGPVTGAYSLLLTADTANALARSVLIAQGMDEGYLDEMRQDILGEVSNVILNGCVSSLADALKVELDSKTPCVRPSALHLTSPGGAEVELLSARAVIESPCGELRADAVFILDLLPTPELEQLLDDADALLRG